MTRAKEVLIEKQQARLDEKLADYLGISYDELLMLGYEIDTNESKDGLIYNYIIQFSNESPQEILDKIGVKDGGWTYIEPWVLDSSDEYYYEDQYEAIIDNHEVYSSFEKEINNLRKLNLIKVDEELSSILKRQIFVGAIGTLETFLSDTFINLVISEDEYFKNFIKNHPEFKKRKFELRDIFDETEKLKDTAKKVMLDTIYHDLPKVREMYRNTFAIEFPRIDKVMKLVLKRHDLVHRNGKTKEGETVKLGNSEITNSLNDIANFAKSLAEMLSSKKGF